MGDELENLRSRLRQAQGVLYELSPDQLKTYEIHKILLELTIAIATVDFEIKHG